ncbi:DegV family protein [Clostridium grantii]|uniref:EDD domain protein, DegV family n=1 Tax=Clostridium grantii DSM 8605 TaxID=1121316 RepID=A0A1M5W5E5_9CLOT|nr:DegV family protein [Clostridium grantii]SHH82690.1 EDD domain protein, DegV family [Clostridium grantii DSM 8605]
MKTVILVDSSSDLPRNFIEDNNLPHVGLICNLDQENHIDDFGKTLTYKHFYKRLREGAMPTTSQVNIFTFEEIFRKHVLNKEAVIYLAFDSAISGTYNSAVIARQHILEEIPEADITVIDTRCASIGEGLIVYKANEMLKNNASKEEIVNWVEDNKFNVRHFFVVEDLQHLRRGGRVSATKAAVGTLLNVKPMLHVNKAGELINIASIRGRKKAIKALVENFDKNMNDKSLDVIGISHGDCLEDAVFLQGLLEEKYEFKEVLINHVGPVIASHTGAGMLALCFIGKEREE